MSKHELKDYNFNGIRIIYIPGRYGSSYLLCGEYNAMMNDKVLYEQTVERLSGYPVFSVFPGHGQPVHGATGLLSDYISSVEECGLINKTGNGIRNSVK